MRDSLCSTRPLSRTFNVLQYLEVLPYSTIRKHKNEYEKLKKEIFMDRGCNTLYSWKLLCRTKLCARRIKMTNLHMNRCGSQVQIKSAFDPITCWFCPFYIFLHIIFVQIQTLHEYISLHPLSILFSIFSMHVLMCFLLWSTGGTWTPFHPCMRDAWPTAIFLVFLFCG